MVTPRFDGHIVIQLDKLVVLALERASRAERQRQVSGSMPTRQRLLKVRDQAMREAEAWFALSTYVREPQAETTDKTDEFAGLFDD